MIRTSSGWGAHRTPALSFSTGRVAGPPIKENTTVHIKRRVAGLAVAAVTAGGLALGAGSALADTPPSTLADTPPSTPAPTADHANSQICTVRIPAALARIDKVTARINGDASVRGSTAWLQSKADKARSAGYTALADLLTERASNRPERLTELAKLKTEVQHVQSTDCAS
jgi:hypothetical protein